MAIEDLLKNKPKMADVPSESPKLRRGELSSSSIFDKEESGKAPETLEEVQKEASSILKTGTTRVARLKASGLHPNEDSFMRKYRMRQVRKRGRLTRGEIIARSEKVHLAKSHNFKTSLKKLGPLARQIAGKPLQHAITQMRFSPKKAAKDILEQLKQIKNEAVLTKNFDPEQTYISQAWVGRGEPEKDILYRARSRIDIIEKPYTHIGIILKENKTLDRLAREKEEKKLRKKVLMQLPNRPIYGQHQYYTW